MPHKPQPLSSTAWLLFVGAGGGDGGGGAASGDPGQRLFFPVDCGALGQILKDGTKNSSWYYVECVDRMVRNRTVCFRHAAAFAHCMRTCVMCTCACACAHVNRVFDISRDWSRSRIKSCNPKNQIWDFSRNKWYLSQSGCGIKSGINTTFLARNCGSALTAQPRRTTEPGVLGAWTILRDIGTSAQNRRVIKSIP